ncbi:hypothetical protein MRB53_008719 [Persea americana]|uniref:Uncharacterized protein n=1 Tax=Persea americana TaxID=3435 RepID=A0ACC2MNM5_PERAE|nr:hypothetical protein MRB53_008719 [Persea americana]
MKARVVEGDGEGDDDDDNGRGCHSGCLTALVRCQNHQRPATSFGRCYFSALPPTLAPIFVAGKIYQQPLSDRIPVADINSDPFVGGR